MHVVDDGEREFQRRYGAWAPLDPATAAAVLQGFPGSTWVVGGWAIEAFTGLTRDHEDIDIAFFRRDVAALVDHLEPRYQAFAVGDGMTMRGLTTQTPTMPTWADQAWVRESASAPWLMDLIANEDASGRWVFRRDPSVTAALDDVSWLDDSGIRYQNPEIVLAHKAKLDRLKDRQDLASVLPLIDDGRRAWLQDTIARIHPGHSWLPLLT